MSPVRSVILIIALLVAAARGAQPEAPSRAAKAAVQAADATVEAYLERHGLKPLLAEQLALRLPESAGDERSRIADRLGTLYVELIGAARTAEERASWQARARDLIKRVPEAETYELRLDLARTVYAKAEEAAEQWRLRRADAAAKSAAEGDLRALNKEFAMIAADLNRRVDQLDRGNAANREQDLAEARRLRAIAQYYAGWSGYYLAFLTNDVGLAAECLRNFGWVLGRTGGQPAAVDRLPRANLKHEDVCRAVIGAAMCSSLAGSDAEALRWLRVLDESLDVPEKIKSQLVMRRIVVLAQAKKWSDLEAEVARHRQITRTGPTAGEPGRRLDPTAARLLAVLAFESGPTGGAEATRLGQVGFEDLIAAGQIAHVLDLATIYGTMPLGEKGFIAHYVRGAAAYKRAAGAHEAAGQPLDKPTTDAAAVNLYREAASLLDEAARQDDVQGYPTDLLKAGLLRGRALFYAGDYEAAADAFAQASASAQSVNQPDDAHEGLWLAIVALDTALRADPALRGSSLAERLDELATLFQRLYPGTERAATLLINQRGGSKVRDEEAVKTLLAVAKTSSIYEASRRQAARILYRLYRGASGEDRSFQAARFATVGEEVLATERRDAVSAKAEDAQAASTRAITTARQLLDVMLSGNSPDLGRAQAVLDVIAAIAAYNKVDLKPYEEELDFRRFQMLVAKGDIAAAEAVAERLGGAHSAPGGTLEKPERVSRWALSAQRALYMRDIALLKSLDNAGNAGQAAPDATAETRLIEVARSAVRHGEVVRSQFAETPDALADGGVAALYNDLAYAASIVGEKAGDRSMLELAVRLDRILLAAQPRQIAPLRRLARLSESVGDVRLALACWRELASGWAEGSADWFGARYHVLRLLAESEPVEARTQLAQHAVLYPTYGPPPWGLLLRQLHERLGGAPALQPAAPTGTVGGAP